MKKDMCVRCGDGLINLRVGAIILKDGKMLMAGRSDHPEYLYTVGGRIKFGETSEEAIVREVFEETGVQLEIDRLGFVQQDYFYGDVVPYVGMLIYELTFYFYMKVPDDFNPVSPTFSEEDHEEYLRWITPDEPLRLFPEFFRTELQHPQKEVKYFRTDGRLKN